MYLKKSKNHPEWEIHGPNHLHHFRFLTLKHKHLPTQLHPHLPVYWRPRIRLSSDGFSLHYQPPKFAQPHSACQIPKSISNLPSSITHQRAPPEIALNKSSTHALPQVHWDVRPSTGRNASPPPNVFPAPKSLVGCQCSTSHEVLASPTPSRIYHQRQWNEEKVEWLVNDTLMLHVGGFVYSTMNPLWTDFLLGQIYLGPSKTTITNNQPFPDGVNIEVNFW